MYGACIIFIDEIDAIGMSRQAGSGGGGMFGMGGGSGLLNELLLQMDPPNIDNSRDCQDASLARASAQEGRAAGGADNRSNQLA